MRGILYEGHSVWLFILITVVIGGWAAWQTGQAVAKTWRPMLVLVPYTLLLAGAVRFLHFALFQGTLLSLQFFLVDWVILFGIALIGWRVRRAAQMATQYAFAFEGTGPLGWKRRGREPS